MGIESRASISWQRPDVWPSSPVSDDFFAGLLDFSQHSFESRLETAVSLTPTSQTIDAGQIFLTELLGGLVTIRFIRLSS